MGLSGEGLLAFEWTMIAVTIVLVVARLHLRFNYIGIGLVISDWFIFATLVCNTLLTCTDTYLYVRGVWSESIDYYIAGWVISENYELTVLKIFYASVFPWYLAQYLNKGILITLYYHVFAQQSGRIRTSLHVLSCFTISAFIVTVCVNLLLCSWGCHWTVSNLCSSSCLNRQDNIAFALHFANDVWIFVFPLVLISQLCMSKAQKISTSITFGLGILNIGITFTRWLINQTTIGPDEDLATAAEGNTTLKINGPDVEHAPA
ncbi:unnamed protein product [Clonostachys rhizophaga]|uniref:Rhodopsin domain-containing protein n=1 Tax=Clonostachys rhizophaga TaxID=160324 RepID=A0A9N9YTW3_9HYPO|nr:unnamed protein product [Clonostachys rhizophaga]